MSALFVLLAILSYFVLYSEEVDDFEYNIKRGIFAVVLVFLAFGITQARDGPFYRPHPILWRFILTCGVLYEICLVFLLFQTPKDFRRLILFIDPDLNVPITEKAYGGDGDCDIYDSNNPTNPWHHVTDKLDGFVVAHALGWFSKTLIIRDFWMTNMLSISFEFLEYSLEHQLPNFSECWWDHWILDVLICNFGGIVLGNMALKTLQNKEYNWIGIRHQIGVKKKMKRMITQFTPYSWVSFSWAPKASTFRWFSITFVMIMLLICDLNTFYLKFVIWATPDHCYVIGRMFFLAAFGAVAIREVYDYLCGVTSDVGQSAWVSVAILITEMIICIKFGWETISMPFPPHIKLFWAILLFIYLMWSFWPAWNVDISRDKPTPTEFETEEDGNFNKNKND